MLDATSLSVVVPEQQSILEDNAILICFVVLKSSVFSFSSCDWSSILSLSFFTTRSTFCSNCIHAFALIPFMENDVVFSSIFVNSLVLGFFEDGSSFATHSVAFYRDFTFCSRVCDWVLFSPSAFVKKNCSSSATSEEDVVTSMHVICTFSLILRRIFFVSLNPSLEGQSSAVLIVPAICTALEWNCNT